jgi:hypothetical protein
MFLVWIHDVNIKYTTNTWIKVKNFAPFYRHWGRTAHRGSRSIVLPFHDHGTRRGWGVSVTSRPLFTTGKDLVPIVQEAGWAPRPVWTGAENLTSQGLVRLSPPDFDLFPKLNKPLSGKRFRSIEEVSNEVTWVIRRINNEGVQTGIQELPKRWTAVIKHNGDYIEGLYMYFVK